MSAFARHAAIAMNVLFPAVALCAEPMFMMMSVFCADGGGDRTRVAIYSCAGGVVALPLLLTMPFAIVSAVLLMRRWVAAAFVVACGPIVEAAAIVYYFKAR